MMSPTSGTSLKEAARVVFSLDDLCDEFDPWEPLHALKEKYPGLRVTLFAIPARCSDGLLARYRALDWVELGVHGYHHALRECLVWGFEETMEKLEELEGLGWTKLFKPPNWQINDQVYKALQFRNWKVADHAAYAWSSHKLTIDRYTYNLPGFDGTTIQGHTWDVMGNGPSDWDEMLKDVPKDSEFSFVSEACAPLSWHYDEPDKIQDEESSWSHQSAWGQLALKNFHLCFDGVDSPGKIADFGGNDGFVASKAREAGFDVTVIDGMPNRIAYADMGSRVPAVCANLTSIPIPDDAFDWGYCSHTLEHIPDIEAAWSEIKRLCKKGCFVVLPVESEETFNDNEAHFHRADHEGWCELLGLREIDRNPNNLVAVWERE